MSDENAKGASDTDTKFLMIAGVLLLLIIILLGGLWLSMRARAMQAERDLAVLQTQQKATGGIRFTGSQEELEAMLRQAAAKAMCQAVNRDNLKTEQINLNGQKIPALRLPAKTAETLGFRPGDVIIVEKAAPTTATAPMTAPASLKRAGRMEKSPG